MTLQSLTEEYKAARDAMQEKISASVMTEANEFFDANPDVWGFAWEQYTPHFNDGEPCEFWVHEIYAMAQGYDPDDGEYLEDSESCLNTYGVDTPKPVEDFVSSLAGIPDEIMQSFGEGRVTLTREGIDVEEISHD